MLSYLNVWPQQLSCQPEGAQSRPHSCKQQWFPWLLMSFFLFAVPRKAAGEQAIVAGSGHLFSAIILPACPAALSSMLDLLYMSRVVREHSLSSASQIRERQVIAHQGQRLTKPVTPLFLGLGRGDLLRTYTVKGTCAKNSGHSPHVAAQAHGRGGQYAWCPWPWILLDK